MSNTIVLFFSQETILEELAQIKHLALTGSPVHRAQLKCSTGGRVPPDPTYWST